jgi:Predicted pyridoxal phosphate-dependent enzyme apparently involved in regulation of cell wall biogenesis
MDTLKGIALYRVHMPLGIEQDLAAVLHSGQIANGPLVTEFETQLASFLSTPFVTSAGDVSSALMVALLSCGVTANDEVLTSPLACLATTMPVRALHATVRWCDVNPQTGNIDPSSISARITPRTRAILVYHWAGYPADLEAIYKIAHERGLPVIEDANEALGAQWKGRPIGSTGAEATVFSFHPIRHINTIDGAAITFSTEALFNVGRWTKRYGIHQPSFRDKLGEINPESDICRPGINSYMNQVSAAVGIAQMRYLKSIVSQHVANARLLDSAFQDVNGIEPVRPLANAQPSPWVYTILVDRRDDLMHALRARGIECSRVHFRNDRYTVFGRSDVELPGVESFAARSLCIPCGWWVTPTDIECIVDAIRAGW